MKIRIDKDIVEFMPEHEAEAVELEALWIKMGNCVGGTKQLEPMGVYVRGNDKSARFHIEGLTEQEANTIPRCWPPMTTTSTATSVTAPSTSKRASPSPSAAAG